MASVEAEASRDERSSAGGLIYDGFISYSHAADDLLAPRLQAGLQKFAKPWWKRRAVRMFRDESSLAANPHLWSSITDALDKSGWFVLLLSPDAAESPWVNNEVEYWLEHKDPDRIIPVLTDGEFAWADDDIVSDAAPPALVGAFSDEPRWVDLRFARTEEQLDLKNPRFSATIADVASAIRGVPKDELESEEVRQHRRTTRTAWAAGVGLVALLVLAVAAAVFALDQRNEAQQLAGAEATARLEADANAAEAASNAEDAAANAVEADANAAQAQQNANLARSRELAASAINVLDNDSELSILLALAAIKEAPSGTAVPLEAQSALREATHATVVLSRQVLSEDGGSIAVALSPDAARLAVSSSLGRFVRLFDTSTWELLWEYQDESIDTYFEIAFSPDGEIVAESIVDSGSDVSSYQPGPNDVAEDDLSGRVVLLDAATGTDMDIIEYPQCPTPVMFGTPFSPDGKWLAVGVTVDAGCDIFAGEWSVELLNTETLEVDHRLPAPHIPFVSWSADGKRLSIAEGVFLDLAVTTVYETDGFTELIELPGILTGTLSPSGDLVVGNDEFRVPTVVDVETGDLVDRMTGLSDFGRGTIWSSDGSQVIAGSDGPMTIVWDRFTGEVTHRLTTSGPAESVVFDPVNDWLYVSNSEGVVTVWDLSGSADGELATQRIDRWVQSNSINVAGSNGAFFGIDNEAGTWELWRFDPATGELIGDSIDVIGYQNTAPLPDGRHALAFVDGETVGPIEVWDPESGERVELTGCWIDQTPDADACLDREGTFPGLEHLYVSPDGTSLLVGLGDGTGLIYDLPSLEETARFEGEVADYGFEGDIAEYGGSWVVRIDDIVAFTVLDLASQTPVADFTTDCPLSGWALEASPDGRFFAWATDCGEVIIAETSTWEIVSTIQAHTGRIRGLAFSADASMLMTGATDGTVAVWDTETLVELARIPLEGASDGHFIDDEHVVVGTSEGLWTVLTLDLNELIGLSIDRLTRGFTPEECDRYAINPCPMLDEMRGEV